MIKQLLVTGDCHGKFERFYDYSYNGNYSETGFLVLGDLGCNFYGDTRGDAQRKRKLNNIGCKFYIVRGNHEERPECLPNIEEGYDENVEGKVMYQPEYLNIRYLLDGGEYTINGHKCLVIGGAYSVDKYWRLERAGINKLPTGPNAHNWIAKQAGWFDNEQLTKEEQNEILNRVKYKYYDFILTHTCPLNWEPRDLFLNGINQREVDKSMELFLQEIEYNCGWKIWLFGHYHSDRLERPCVEQYYQDIEDIENIWNRWYGERTIKEEWWLTKSPQFYYNDVVRFEYN